MQQKIWGFLVFAKVLETKLSFIKVKIEKDVEIINSFLKKEEELIVNKLFVKKINESVWEELISKN